MRSRGDDATTLFLLLLLLLLPPSVPSAGSRSDGGGSVNNDCGATVPHTELRFNRRPPPLLLPLLPVFSAVAATLALTPSP